MQRLVLFLLSTFLYLAASKGQSDRFFNNFQDDSINSQWMNKNTILVDKDSATNFFSRTDAQHPYSSGLEQNIPENFHKKNFRLSVNGRVRVSVQGAKNQLVVSIAENDSPVYWNGLQIPDSAGSGGHWSSFSFTALFPENLSPSCKIKIFVWNADGLSVTDVDDLEILFTEIKNPTFLDWHPSKGTTAQNLLFENKYFKFYADTVKGTVSIFSATNDTIIKSSTLYHLYLEPSNHLTVMGGSSMQSLRKTVNENTTTLSWVNPGEVCLTRVEVIMQKESEEIEFKVASEFLEEILVSRDAWVFDAAVPLREVYRKNTICDTKDFQAEYWVDKEGAKFGDKENSLLLYHNPGTSSIQVDSRSNQVIVNLDYQGDHPFQHFPLRDSMMHIKEDLSCSIYKAGEVRKNTFSIHAGKKIDFVPRIMLNPNGFLAAHVFTEHADWTDLPTHRAVYFGSEEITDASKATGGFIKNKIPVTKSVFYANPDKVKNSDSRHESIFKTPIASIKNTPGFKEFLDQVYKSGNEICLHTPDQYTSKSSLIEEACAFMKKNFNTVTWIDHGYDNGPKNNREAFVCDGLDSSSTSYAADSWKKYGVKFFWNSYYEDFVTDDSDFFDFNGSPMHPYPGFGDAAPQPLYWKHPTRTGDFYSWPTRDLLEMPDVKSWSYHFSADRMNDFVKQRAVKFEHCYPAGSIVRKGYWMKNDKNVLVVESEFENILQRLRAYGDSGLINNTTVRDLMNYWIDREKIRIEYTDSSTVVITNMNTHPVKGISFSVAAKNISSGKQMHQKFFGNDLIFWFDMDANQKTSVTFSN